MMDILAPFLGFAVLVTLGILGWSCWVYWTTPEGEFRTLPKRGKMVYRVGQIVTLVSGVTVAGIIAWLVGRAIMGGM